MKKPQNCRIDGLSTWELEALLQDELAREEKDYVLIHQLLESLKAKSTALPEVTQEEVDEAMLTLQESKIVPKEKKRPALWRKPLLAVAAVFCVVLLAVPMASGTPFVQELIAKWNDKLFWIESPGSPVEAPEGYVFQTDNPGLQQLYDAVTELGITAPVVPMWLPEGSELVHLDTLISEENVKLRALFRTDGIDVTFFIKTMNYLDTSLRKNETKPEIWCFMGREHFFVSNDVSAKVAWSTGEHEISVFAPLEKRCLYKIVKSIYYGSVE